MDRPDNLDASLKAWEKTIEVQQHFNEIEMRIRNFAITLAAAVMSGVAFTMKEHMVALTFGVAVPVGTLIGLGGLIAWELFHMMDGFWYHGYLKAAGAHAETIETSLKGFVPGIGLSTAISAAGDKSSGRWTSTQRITLFYVTGAILLLVVALAPLSIKGQEDSQRASLENRQREQAQADKSWSRNRECAEQADRLATRFGWDKTSSTPISVTGWGSHFNNSRNECLVRVAYMNQSAKKDPTLPLATYSLFEAFGGSEIASCTDSSVVGARDFCSVDEGSQKHGGDCAACRGFVRDRMIQ